MMQIVTEHAIRKALDGTFIRLGADGQIECKKVSRGFVPAYDERRQEPIRRKLRVGRRVPFTPDEDAEIIALTKAHKSKTHIALAIGRKYQSVQYRQEWLREKGLL